MKEKRVKRKNRISSTVVAFIMLCVFVQSVSAAQISVQPAFQTVSTGENFTVNIYVEPEGSEDVFGASYHLHFNTSLLNATAQTNGMFLSWDGVSTYIKSEINNTIGEIKYAETRLDGSAGGVTNPGVLAIITFQAIAEHGTSELGLDTVKLSNSSAGHVPANISNGSVAIAEPDLVINDIWKCWQNCSICYNITNTGKGTAPAGHNTSLYVDGGEVAHDEVPAALAPDENYTACFDFIWTFTSPEDNITVCADANETVAESNESNNCLTTIWDLGYCGDVTPLYGVINLADVATLYSHVARGTPIGNEWAGDVTPVHGVINLADVATLYSHVARSTVLDCRCA